MIIDKLKIMILSIAIISSIACSAGSVISADDGAIGIVRGFPLSVCVESEEDLSFVLDVTDYINRYLDKAVFVLGDDDCDVSIEMGYDMDVFQHEDGMVILGETLTAYGSGFIIHSDIYMGGGSSSPKSEKVLIHELGHALGFGHSESGIMEGVIDFSLPLDVLMYDGFSQWFDEIYGGDL